ncbi:MAG: DUF983 domain-containing protein [Ilumatobacteraceae bacterium]
MIRRRPSLKLALLRAITLRCPRCGSRRTFLRGWFRRFNRCRTCGIRWRREEGFELGAVTVNTVITMFTLVVAMAVAFIATVPDVPVVQAVVSLGIVAAVMPVLIYPFSYTIWLAIDLAVHPPDAAEMAQAEMAAAEMAQAEMAQAERSQDDAADPDP